MTFEHEKTRQSLQLAFETIFAKFDCPFSDDDEVDIEELRVVKKGKTLRQAPVRPFGSVFRREHDHSTLSDENSETDDAYTTVDDDEYLRSMHRDLVGKRQNIQERSKQSSQELLSMSMPQIDKFFDNELMDVLLCEGKNFVSQVLQCMSVCGAEQRFESVLLDFIVAGL